MKWLHCLATFVLMGRWPWPHSLPWSINDMVYQDSTLRSSTSCLDRYILPTVSAYLKSFEGCSRCIRELGPTGVVDLRARGLRRA
ncbi:hypothetical protein BU26DRAFT_89333 [Trematosphaeria pertusa]|uniref:Secreted protein n=1 Tax=Trematosphaeria pertusa TaxID=390896 RepID=A0A6A6I3T3_9PLEO|nr:uncharacterized protein BU26DRAFT_89333 [Trematosphaeria pertusa]KAF2244927.1 hypothetical protein BU26DRAFT_89333 [Trematosphaeria pertusa]